MGCLIPLLALISPRLAFVVVWLFTGRVGDAFDNLLLPVFGLLFVPWTTLVYVFVAPGDVTGIDWVWLGVALVADIGSWGSGPLARKNR